MYLLQKKKKKHNLGESIRHIKLIYFRLNRHFQTLKQLENFEIN